MDSARENITDRFVSLQEASEILSVPVQSLIEWNENNILKPTITQSGDVGYRYNQISKFLTIQKFLHNNNFPAHPQNTPVPEVQKMSCEINNTVPSLNTPFETKENFISGSETKRPSKKIHLLPYYAIFSLFIVIIFSLSILTYSNQNIISPIPQTNLKSSEVPNNLASSDTFTLNSPIIKIKIPALLDNKNNYTYNLGGASYKSNNNDLTIPDSMFEKDQSTKFVQPFYTNTASLPKDTSDQIVNYSAYDLSKNYLARANCPSCTSDSKSSVIDNEGNIKGISDNSDLLATTYGTVGLSNGNQTSKQAVNPYFLLSLLFMGLYLVISSFRKQLAYSRVTDMSYSPRVYLEDQKILSIDQKTDGTVILLFNNKEYRISKPELNSESDQFIERLLGNSTENVKEYNYDIFKDKNLKINAPLSKLVTRLGFTGLKRDLFFPRTSKDRVLFRKYLTMDDISSMGLSLENISKELGS